MTEVKQIHTRKTAAPTVTEKRQSCRCAPYLHSLAQAHVIAQNGPSVGSEVWVQEAYPLSLVVSQVPVQCCRYLKTWVSKSPG